ncbi:MAG: hypothetical protein Q8N60_02365 [Candidatus Diapherotrites archaeon]|nr:hypothetical protein [Candidatus Diapherotrites archaeon]
MSFYRIMVDSFLLLRACPKLFIPKILIAFLLLPTFILIPEFIVESGIFSIAQGIFSIAQPITRQQSIELMQTIMPLIAIVLYGLLIDLIDFYLVNPMYPIMVNDFYRKKQVLFKPAFRSVVHKFRTIFPTLSVILLISFAALIPPAVLIVIALFSGDAMLLAASSVVGILVVFVLFVVFYLIYPVSTLEKFDYRKAIGETTRASLKHKINVAKAFVISVAITGLSYGLGWAITMIDSPDLAPKMAIFALILVTRLLVALFSTYQYVLNSVFYFGFEKRQFLKVA